MFKMFPQQLIQMINLSLYRNPKTSCDVSILHNHEKKKKWHTQLLCVIICVGSQPGRDRRTCSFLWQQQRANCRLHLPAQISSPQLTGRIRSQNSLSPPQFLGVPSHSVTCTCFLAPETILGGFISMQWMFPKGVGTGPTPRRWFISFYLPSLTSCLSDFTILESLAGPYTQQTGLPLSHTSSPHLTSPSPSQLQWPAPSN